jgi:hypothetical protein
MRLCLGLFFLLIVVGSEARADAFVPLDGAWLRLSPPTLVTSPANGPAVLYAGPANTLVGVSTPFFFPAPTTFSIFGALGDWPTFPTCASLRTPQRLLFSSDRPFSTGVSTTISPNNRFRWCAVATTAFGESESQVNELFVYDTNASFPHWLLATNNDSLCSGVRVNRCGSATSCASQGGSCFAWQSGCNEWFPALACGDLGL